MLAVAGVRFCCIAYVLGYQFWRAVRSFHELFERTAQGPDKRANDLLKTPAAQNILNQVSQS